LHFNFSFKKIRQSSVLLPYSGLMRTCQVAIILKTKKFHKPKDPFISFLENLLSPDEFLANVADDYNALIIRKPVRKYATHPSSCVWDRKTSVGAFLFFCFLKVKDPVSLTNKKKIICVTHPSINFLLFICFLLALFAICLGKYV
jgi:hypothetical protein